MFKVHLPSDLLPGNSTVARGRQLSADRQSEPQEKPGEGAAGSPGRE